MVMISHINFAFLIVISILQTNAHSDKNNKLKSATIEAIVEKICNVSLKSLVDKPADKKYSILTKIEDKLKNSTIGSGVEGHKYVKFIMHGVKLIIFNGSKETDTNNESAITFTSGPNVESTADEKRAKEQAIHNIAVKIEKLVKKYLKDAKTMESKQAVIDTIKKKVMDAANRRHMIIHDKHKEIKSYSNIIAKGIDLMIKKNAENDTRRAGSNVEHTKSNKGVRLKIMHAAISPTPPLPAHRDLPNTTTCESILEEICSSTKNLNTYTCRYDKNSFPLEKLCNGKFDCVDKSDEEDCAEQAMEKIKSAGRTMSQIESAMSRRCISPSLDKEILSQQNQVLRTVLHAQLRFIEKYSRPHIAEVVNPRRSEINKDIIKKTANEVALVVSSLAMALDGSLCARRFTYANIEKIAIRYSGDTDADEPLDQILRPKTISVTSCACDGMLCVNSSCTEVCTRICWQKYGLNRWSCRAMDGGPSVTMETLCDGKLDCYDETDETGCALGSITKFEAGKIYNNILREIISKTKSKEYYFVLSNLLNLHDSVKLLQKMSVQRDIDTLNFKIIREQCFTTIESIYEAFLNENNVNKLNSGYVFLISISEQLMNAMKRSRTGNDRIISTDRCLCSGARCAIPRCSKLCVRACSVEPNFTRYFCGDKKLNFDIPTSNICNGKPNCPNGEDEKDCLQEVCRSHHLVVLRHKLKDIGQKQSGSALGEVLKSWKAKVTATLMLAEKEGRPTPKELKDTIDNILKDLVMSYASLSYSRRNNENKALKEFFKISQTVMESIKSCGQ